MSANYISAALRQRVIEAAGNCCGYCRSAQQYVMGILEIEHLIPLALGGTNDEFNLWLACGLCNRYKGLQTSAIDPFSSAEVPLFNPRRQSWKEHFCWDEAGILLLA